MQEESVDELRIALSEACTTAVMTHSEAGLTDPVCVAWDADETQVVIEVTSQILPASPDDVGSSTMSLASRLLLSQALLESLAAKVELEKTDSTTKTRLIFSL